MTVGADCDGKNPTTLYAPGVGKPNDSWVNCLYVHFVVHPSVSVDRFAGQPGRALGPVWGADRHPPAAAAHFNNSDGFACGRSIGRGAAGRRQ